RRHTRFSRDWSSACALPIYVGFLWRDVAVLRIRSLSGLGREGREAALAENQVHVARGGVSHRRAHDDRGTLPERHRVIPEIRQSLVLAFLEPLLEALELEIARRDVRQERALGLFVADENKLSATLDHEQLPAAYDCPTVLQRSESPDAQVTECVHQMVVRVHLMDALRYLCVVRFGALE